MNMIETKEDLIGVIVTIPTIEVMRCGNIFKQPGQIECKEKLSQEIRDYLYKLWWDRNETKI